jgi:hypothetical protein
MRLDFLRSVSLIVALILLLQIGCQEQAKAPGIGQKETETVAKASETAPKITFANVVHEFGQIAARKKYAAEFKFTNTGDGLLEITEVKRCCGVVAKLDKREFAPGESGVIKVEYTSGRSTSVMMRKLYVSSNDKTNPKVALTIKAKVVQKVAYEPKKLNLVLKEENAGCPNLTLTSVDKQPFSIKAFRSTGQGITADVDPSVEATEFVLVPKVDLEKLQSRSVGFVSIDLTHPECKKVTLSFNTLLRFEFKPRSIMVFNPEPQKPFVKKISLVSNYNEDFEVESTSSKNGIAKVTSQEKTPQGYQFEVEIAAPPNDDTGKFGDVLYVNLKRGEKLEIICYGRYVSKEE